MLVYWCTALQGIIYDVSFLLRARFKIIIIDMQFILGSRCAHIAGCRVNMRLTQSANKMLACRIIFGKLTLLKHVKEIMFAKRNRLGSS